ncbi:hypothetical protein [Natronoglomus mannanivorans]|uniref:Uncharacterized protein n=1 Tax=Natronoglomus mannanivorans TaxID=2979990 RepID=A0AAP2Z2V1_9EURY|nr:hypothetical protein [Halobacteria archaeon AArc-xg1-1]
MTDLSLGDLQSHVLGILDESIKTPGVIHQELQQDGHAREMSRADVVDLLEVMREHGQLEYAHGEFREYTIDQ